MSEDSILRELRANGPVALDFMAGRDFMQYKRGVLSEATSSVGQQAYEAVKDIVLAQITTSLISETDS
jgi:hypothetical protein